MNSSVLLIVVALLLTVLPSADAFHHEQHDAMAIAHDLIQGEKSSSSLEIPLSSSCWATAIALLGSPGTDAASFCANLPESSQKRLALELARCHLEDTQKPLFHNPWKAQECAKTSPLSNYEALRSCLSGLTDAGEHAYTHYMPYLQALCTRKTQELFLQHQQSIKDGLASEYAKMSRASMDHIEYVQHATTKHAEELKAKLAEIRTVIQKQIEEQLGEFVRHEFGDLLAQAMQQQTNEQSLAFQEILSNIQLQDLERKKQNDDWAHYQSGMFLKHAKEMERQRDAIRESRERIEDLSGKVSRTSTAMQPLIGLEAFMKAALEGYSWISFLLHFLATFNVVWVVTRPDRCHRFRSYMFAVVITEAVLELALKGANMHGIIDEVDRIGLTTELRRLALLLECMTYLAGLFMSFFAGSNCIEKEMNLKALIDHQVRKSAQPVYYHECEDNGAMQFSQQVEHPGYTSTQSYDHQLRLSTIPLQQNNISKKPKVRASGRTSQTMVESLPTHRQHLNARKNPSQVGDIRISRGQSQIISPRTPAQNSYVTPYDFIETIDEPPEETPPLETKAVPCGTKRQAGVSLDNEPTSKKRAQHRFN